MLFNFSALIFTIISYFTLFQSVLADDPEPSYITTTLTTDSKTIVTTSELPTPTLVWVTGYDENGELQTTQSPYTQHFEKMWTTTTPVPMGTIGLGSITGTVGTLRVYPSTTVSLIKSKK